MNFTIEHFEEKMVRGYMISTNMKLAPVDCVNIWEKITPQINNIESYGLSFDFSGSSFHYMAAVSTNDLKPSSETSDSVIPEGLYLRYDSRDLSELSKIIAYVYSEWEKKQQKYKLALSGVTFELYHKDYKVTGSYSLFFPVTENK